MVYSVDPSASRRQSVGIEAEPIRRSEALLARFLPQSSRSSLAFGGAPMPNLNISIHFYRSPLSIFSSVSIFRTQNLWLWFMLAPSIVANQRQRTAGLRW